MRHIIRTGLQLSILMTAPGVGLIASGQTTKPKAPADVQQSLRDAWGRADQLIDSLIKKVSPSLVQVMVTSYGPLEETLGRTGERIGQQRVIGSGFIIDPDGYIVTNAQVVKGFQRIQGRFTTTRLRSVASQRTLVEGNYRPGSHRRPDARN